MKTLDGTKQVFKHYTDEDRQVWKALYDRQEPSMEKYFAKEYMTALGEIGLDDGEIPNFEKINEVLGTSTQWGLHGVKEIVEIEDFLDLMISRSFPATTWVRTMSQLDYLEEPDMFHDVLGHVPLLNNPSFASFLHELGKIGTEFNHNPAALTMIQRMYWFTVEFGLIEQNGLKAYGAGVISSHGELLNFQSDASAKKRFDTKEIMATDFRSDIVQPIYYVIDSMDQLNESLNDVRRIIETETREP